MKDYVAEKNATVIWNGDVVVFGAGIAGIIAACSSAKAGQKTLLIESVPTLGREVSREWLETIPPCGLAENLLRLCERQKARQGNQIDIFTATLAFDQVVADAGVNAIVCALPMRPLADRQGILAGVEIVGKSGRQAVVAKKLIDATPGRIFSRNILGIDMPQIVSVQRRVCIHGVEKLPIGDLAVPSSLKIESVKIIPTIWRSEALISFKLCVEPVLSRADILAKTQHCAIELVAWLRKEIPGFASASLVEISPSFTPEYKSDSTSFQPLAGTGIHPLPLSSKIAEEIASTEKLLAEISWSEKASSVLPCQDFPAKCKFLKTSELKASEDQELEIISLPPLAVNHHSGSDIVVAGCGTGGAFAALAAAEGETSVTVLEPNDMIGGMGIAGRIHYYYYGLPGGLQDGIDKDTDADSVRIAGNFAGFHPVVKADKIFRGFKEKNIEIMSGHIAFGVIKKGQNITAVLSASDDGYHLFPCKVAIDGTGDGDLAAAAGAKFRLGRDGDGFPQPFSYTPTLVSNGCLTFSNFDIGWVDPTDTLDYSRAHFEGRRTLLGYGPFSEEYHYCTLAPILGLRESRFIKGRTTLTLEDFLEGRTYSDTVCEGYAHHDNHELNYGEESDWAYKYVVMCGLWEKLLRGEVPYGVLLPRKIRNLLMACRALSVDHDMHQLLRMQRDLQKIGEVAGAAAALAVRNGVAPDSLDTDELRRMLESRGTLPSVKAEAPLKLPANELLELLGSDKNGMAMWRLIQLPESDVPDWSEFFKSETDQRRRFLAAVVVANREENNIEAAQILRKVAKERLAGPALGHRSPEPFLLAALALVKMADPEALQLLENILADDKNLNPPSILLVLRGIAEIGDPRGAGAIQKFLKRTENEEFLLPLSGCHQERKTSCRFQIIARAVKTLKALGCLEESFRLEPYMNHGSLPIRRHAHRLMK